MLTITQIKQLMCDYNLRPNKRLGQNFIVDKNIVEKIIRFAGLSSGDVVLEIGAGLGNITTDIAKSVKKVIAVEFDKGLCEVLKKTLSGFKNVELVCQDILEFDFKGHSQNGKIKVIGNLPYYMTTPVLEHLIENRDYIIDALIMVQRELGERLLAPPGSRRCGSISYYLKFYAELEFKSVVKRACFFPKPDVDSILLYMKFLSRPAVHVNNEELLFKIVRSAFNHRRKTVLSSLSDKGMPGLTLTKEEIRGILNNSGISPSRRPESLSLGEFARISDGFQG